MTQPAGTPQYTPLGSFRVMLALFVLVAHARFLFPGNGAFFSIAPEQVGVVLFFVVSGFVMPSAWWSFYQGAPGRFLLNRFVRLVPPWLVVFAIVAILTGGPVSFRDVAINAAMMGPYFNVMWPPGTSPIWTVFVEFNYYFAYFVLFGAIAAGLKVPRALLLFLLACAVGYAFIIVTGGNKRFFGALQWAPYFGLGTALFVWRKRILPSRIGLGAMALMVALIVHHFGSVYVQESDPWIATAALLVLILVLVLLTGPLPAGRWRAIDRRLGDLTYPLYLCHLPVISALAYFGVIRKPQDVLLVLVASGLAAGALHLCVERPLANARNKVRGAQLRSRAFAAEAAPEWAQSGIVNP